MEVIRKFMDASRLLSIMSLPDTFQNRKLELIILPADEPVVPAAQADISKIVQSLVGAVPHTSLSLAELREERLEKYEAID